MMNKFLVAIFLLTSAIPPMVAYFSADALERIDKKSKEPESKDKESSGKESDEKEKDKKYRMIFLIAAVVDIISTIVATIITKGVEYRGFIIAICVINGLYDALNIPVNFSISKIKETNDGDPKKKKNLLKISVIASFMIPVFKQYFNYEILNYFQF